MNFCIYLKITFSYSLVVDRVKTNSIKNDSSIIIN